MWETLDVKINIHDTNSPYFKDKHKNTDVLYLTRQNYHKYEQTGQIHYVFDNYSSG